MQAFNKIRLPGFLLRPRLDIQERKFYHCFMLTGHSVRHPLRVIAEDVRRCQRISGDPGCCAESWDSASSVSRLADRAPFRQFDGTEKSGTKWHIYSKGF